MLMSRGVQWFLLALRKYSQAQGYLKGASWLMSVRPLMTRLSSGFTGFMGSKAGAGSAVGGAGGGVCFSRIASLPDCSGSRRGSRAVAMGSSQFSMVVLLGCFCLLQLQLLRL